MCRRSRGPRRRRPSPTTTPPANGVRPTVNVDRINHVQISARFHAAGLLQAVRTYNLPASYQFANVENALYAESDRPACVRTQPQPRARVLTAPTTNLFRDSSDSARPACVDRDPRPPTLSTDDSRAGSFR